MKFYAPSFYIPTIMPIICISIALFVAPDSFGATQLQAPHAMRKSIALHSTTYQPMIVTPQYDLPPEVWAHVFSQLDLNSLYNAMYCGKKFGMLATQEKKIRHRQLINAAHSGNLVLVKTLLTKGVEVNAKNEYHETALHGAVRESHLEITKLLLGVPGINVDPEDNAQKRPLHYCIPLFRRGDPTEESKLLFNANAILFRKNLPIILLLAQAGANLETRTDLRDTNNYTTLLYLMKMYEPINHSHKFLGFIPDRPKLEGPLEIEMVRKLRKILWPMKQWLAR